LKMIMSLASGDDMKSIKYAVVWAEKCPQAVFDKFKELCPNWKILEWYWITECSPVVAINPIEWAKPWTVWKIIPCLDCKIVKPHPNPPLTGEGTEQIECETWEQWMIYVKWKSIFNWYLDEKIESPFETLSLSPLKKGIIGDSWYKTWDLGFLDEDGFLTITWRLKRFIKIAGEMISLPALEETILKWFWREEELNLAVEALEKDWNAKIVVFSIDDLNVEEINDYIHKNWIPNLVKISELIKIEEIPVLGTGKTDYKVLKKMIKM
jgi:long-chain-fatty-acid--[acyl-carrier-protein] ligase